MPISKSQMTATAMDEVLTMLAIMSKVRLSIPCMDTNEQRKMLQEVVVMTKTAVTEILTEMTTAMEVEMSTKATPKAKRAKAPITREKTKTQAAPMIRLTPFGPRTGVGSMDLIWQQ